MLKRSLIAVAAVAVLASIAPAGEIKLHNWPTQFVPQVITEIPVLIDIGFWVRIKDQDKLKIKLSQVDIHTYAGCTNVNIECNFDLTVSCSISPEKVDGSNVMGGKYSCSVNNADVYAPGGTVEVCAQVKEANLKDVPGGSKNVKVATVKLKVAPQG
jgi:hypothetical protein